MLVLCLPCKVCLSGCVCQRVFVMFCPGPEAAVGEIPAVVIQTNHIGKSYPPNHGSAADEVQDKNRPAAHNSSSAVETLYKGGGATPQPAFDLPVIKSILQRSSFVQCSWKLLLLRNFWHTSPYALPRRFAFDRSGGPLPKKGEIILKRE